MKQTIIATILLAGLTSTAFATSTPPASTNTNTNTSTATGGTNTNTVNTSQGQSQTATGGSATFNEAVQHRRTPDVFIGSPASGPCGGTSGGLGFSGPGFSFSANSAQVSRACDLRELARVAAAAGRQDIANKALEAAAADLGLNDEKAP